MPSSMNTSASPVSTSTQPTGHARKAVLLGALGVVFGDIGTSPIYAFRESLKATGVDAAEPVVVYGVLSLILWAVILIVAVKYVMLVMRADNQGEGGTMSLLALALPATGGRLHKTLLVIGLTGASLFLGDAIITPAISVLSAVEGVEIAMPSIKTYVVPIAALILISLFSIQRRGSGKVGILFRDESRGKDFWPNRNRVESNRITDSGGEDGVAIDIRGKTHDLRITGNVLRETRSPSRRTGLRIAAEARAIAVADNRFEGFASDVADLRSVSG